MRRQARPRPRAQGCAVRRVRVPVDKDAPSGVSASASAKDAPSGVSASHLSHRGRRAAPARRGDKGRALEARPTRRGAKAARSARDGAPPVSPGAERAGRNRWGQGAGGEGARKRSSVPRRGCPAGVETIPLGRPLPDGSSDLPGFIGRTVLSLFGLAPEGVCLAGDVTATAGALLPHPFNLTGACTPLPRRPATAGMEPASSAARVRA